MRFKSKDRSLRERIESKFREYGLKESSCRIYANALILLCDRTTLPKNPFDTLDLKNENGVFDLAFIEDETESFINRNRNGLASRRLNVFFGTIKAWLHANRKIKSKKLFREIKFDKTSLKKSGLTIETLETSHVRDMIGLANANEEIVLGLYGLCGLRPSLIPILKVKHIHFRSITWENGTIKLRKPCFSNRSTRRKRSISSRE